ncbi:hypothetical protein GX441_09470 [bacterium]|nr:hypothetical protein [bacterium]
MMQKNQSNSRRFSLRNGLLWLITWLFLAGLSLDFYNWGKVPRLILGVPLWLWFQAVLILIIGLAYGFLAAAVWKEESE